jgi:hypothetical protein
MLEDGTAPSRRWDSVVGGGIVFAAIVAFVGTSWRSVAQFDDAYISYRYADNLVAGHGLVFNVGERVEGITNLGWTLLVAMGVALGFDAPDVSHYLGLVSGSGLLWLTYVYARIGLDRRHWWMAAVAAPIVFAVPAFPIWAMSGLETPLFACATTGLLIAAARGSPIGVAFAAVVATIVRPEGVLFAGLGFAALLWKTKFGRATVAMALVYGVFVVGLTVFRLQYYGVPLPNTFYAKVRGIDPVMPLRYVASFVCRLLAPLALPAVLCVRRLPVFRLGAASVAMLMVYSFAVGGDFGDHFRFLVPALPILPALAVRGALSAWFLRPSFVRRVGAACLPVALLWASEGAIAGGAAFVVAASLLIVPSIRRNKFAFAGASLFACTCGVAVMLLLHQPAPKDGFGHTVFSDRSSEITRTANADEYFASGARSTVELLQRLDPTPTFIALGSLGMAGYLWPIRMVDLFGLVDPAVPDLKPDVVPGTVQIPGHQWSNAKHLLALRPDCIVAYPTTIRFPATIALTKTWELWQLYRPIPTDLRIRCLPRFVAK